MKKISTVILLIMLLGLVGCSEKRIVLIPQIEYHPTFDTSDFKLSKPYKIDFWIEEEIINNKVNKLMVSEELPMKGFIRDTKILRSNYNTLLKQINNFNIRIKGLNKIQSEKKPTEVEAINHSWFK